MDWRSVKFDWNRARAFLVTAEEGSLSAAARALGMTQPTLGRQVDALEEELGIILFERAGRGLILTPSGLELLDHVRQMGNAASQVSLAASGQSQAVEGTIRITASEIEAITLLPPIIERIRREAPGINVEVLASNASADLLRREADIAIRSFRPTEPELIARKICDSMVRLYASTGFLDQLGRPTRLDKINQADFIGYDPTGFFLETINRLGPTISAANLKIITGNSILHWELVKQGLGISVLPENLCDTEPGIERVLEDEIEGIPIPIWLTTHRELNTSRRVRLVFDILAEELSAVLAG